MSQNKEVLSDIFQPSKDKCKKENSCKREKFLSRVFGIFSEDIVRIWCQNPNSPYEDLGRPSLYNKNDGTYTRTTLDFTFKDRQSNLYVVEMKSEIQYQNFRYFHLENEEQISHSKPTSLLCHHRNKSAFVNFEKLGKDHSAFEVKVKYEQEKVKINGIILIWAKVSPDIEGSYNIGGFHQILSVERMISDLIEWDDKEYKKFIKERNDWCKEMFAKLVEN